MRSLDEFTDINISLLVVYLILNLLITEKFSQAGMPCPPNTFTL